MDTSEVSATAPFLPVNPFAFKVERPRQDCTLFNIADTIGNLALSDLRELNPELDGHAANEPLPAGTVVRLAPTVIPREAAPIGTYFVLGAEERQLELCYEQLEKLVDTVAAETPSASREACFALPSRSVLSKTEQVMQIVKAEAARQLPHVSREINEKGRRPCHIKHMLDTAAVKQQVEAAEKAFTDEMLSLDCFKSSNIPPFLLFEEPSSLTPATIQPHVHDEDNDFCMGHSHRWEFTFQSQLSTQNVETWAVLSCQKLTVLLDAFECLSSQCVSEDSFQNAFLFIGGVFYVDDRHADDPRYEDLTRPLRMMDAVSTWTAQHFEGASDGVLSQNPNLSFGQCRVLSAASTTFKELRLRVGEQCVIRHRGCCDHYFYLSGTHSLHGYARTKRSSYPHRVAKKREVVMRCDLCEQFPSTVMLYGDECSASSPAAYCIMCYELLHKDETDEEASRYVKVVAKPGEFFKRPY